MVENPRDDYIGFRVSTEVKKKIENFASKNKLSIGELLNISALKYMGEIEEVNKILERKIIKK